MPIRSDLQQLPGICKLSFLTFYKAEEKALSRNATEAHLCSLADTNGNKRAEVKDEKPAASRSLKSILSASFGSKKGPVADPKAASGPAGIAGLKIGNISSKVADPLGELHTHFDSMLTMQQTVPCFMLCKHLVTHNRPKISSPHLKISADTLWQAELIFQFLPTTHADCSLQHATVLPHPLAACACTGHHLSCSS